LLAILFYDYFSGSLDGTSLGENHVEKEFDIKTTTRLRLSSLNPASSLFSLDMKNNVSVEIDIAETPSDRLSGLQVQ